MDKDEDDVNEADWKPCSEAIEWVHDQMEADASPREILTRLIPQLSVGENIDEASLWHLVVQLLTEPPLRKKLPRYNTLDDAVQLLRQAKKVIVLTGAGVSVSCGIPDFRSKSGIYARLHETFPDLPNPQAMFDIEFFRRNPKPFYEFAREIFPGQFEPSRSHRFIRLLEERGQLLRNYTQNIDTLEQVAGITNVLHCHGSFATATCCDCKLQVPCESIRSDIMDQKIPRCRCGGVLKPDIVFFGESLPPRFHRHITADKDAVDLLIVVGSSLKVRPVALIPKDPAVRVRRGVEAGHRVLR